MIGREPERAYLRGVLRHARAGHARIVLVAGEAGVGKSRLVNDLVVWASRAGWDVTQGRCTDLGAGALPYAPFTEPLLRRMADGGSVEVPALVPWLGRAQPAGPASVAGGPPGTQPEPEPDRRHVLFESVTRRVAEGSAEAPMLMVVEDAHWADRSTFDLAVYVLERLADRPVVAVFTIRTDHSEGPALDAYLVELARRSLVERLDLARLGRDHILELSRGVLGRDPTPAELERAWRLSEGNPSYAEELLADAGPGIPTGLSQLALGRLSRLGRAAQTVVKAASLGGPVVEYGELAAACGLPVPELAAAVREALDAHLLEPAGKADAFTFRHALIREAVRAGLLPGELTRLRAVSDPAERADGAPGVDSVEQPDRGRTGPDRPPAGAVPLGWVARGPAEAPGDGRAELAGRGLTRRETEVLGLLGRGYTNRQIGRHLQITEKTAAIHVSRILDKLGVANRVEAALMAQRVGLGGES